jgi:hypothetical protein
MKLGLLFFGLFTLSMLVGALGVFRGGIVEMIPFITVHSSGSLLGIWVALGGSPAPWRFVGATLALAVCVFLCRMVWNESPLEESVLAILFYMVAISLPLLIARIGGLRVRQLDKRNPNLVDTLGRLAQKEDESVIDRIPVKRRWPQWSLSSILLWTAAIAVLLSTLSVLGVLREPLIPLCVGGIVLFIMTLVELWLVLGNSWLVARIMVFGLTVVVAVALLYPAERIFRVLDFLGMLVVTLMMALWLLGLLYIVRAAGYRLTWGLDAHD